MKYATLTRMIAVTAMAATLLVAMRPAAEAHHATNFYCSDSGDICQSTRKVDGVRKLGIVMAERYFGRYVLCVTDPMGLKHCVDFRIRELESGLFGDTVRWRRHFPEHGPGRYTVRWYRVPDYGPPTERIGQKLGFHVAG